jgi:CspA family cold shock protein
VSTFEERKPEEPLTSFPPVAKQKGVVKFFNTAAGFGFIAPSDGGRDIFVQADAINGAAALAEGDAVEFEVVADAARGNKAEGVNKI